MKTKSNRNYHPLQFINIPPYAHFMINGVEYAKTGHLQGTTEKGKTSIFYPEEYVSEWWLV